MPGGVVQPLGHHELLVFVPLFLLLVVARTLGELTARVDLPSVVGELLAGVLLGPSLLGALAPRVFDAVFPADPAQFHLLEVVSWLGVTILLVPTGLETDIDDIVQGAPCPVVVVPAGAAADRGSTVVDEHDIDRSLLPTVGTEYS